MRADPGHRSLGELLQERQWAVDEISRPRDKVTRLASDRVNPVQFSSSQKISAARDFDDPLTSRRLLRLSDVESLVGLSRSMIYRLISEGRSRRKLALEPELFGGALPTYLRGKTRSGF
jgi:predicted DNA-binding transcriptional regulator AlpA